MSSEMLQATCCTDARACAEERVATSYKLVPSGTLNVSLTKRQYENGTDRAIFSRFDEHKTSFPFNEVGEVSNQHSLKHHWSSET